VTPVFSAGSSAGATGIRAEQPEAGRGTACEPNWIICAGQRTIAIQESCEKIRRSERIAP